MSAMSEFRSWQNAHADDEPFASDAARAALQTTRPIVALATVDPSEGIPTGKPGYRLIDGEVFYSEVWLNS